MADAAGVSLTTASHALSGKGRVPEATRSRVRNAAEQLGYRPNRAARQLATGRSMTLAVQMAGAADGSVAMIPESSYFVSLLNGASSAAAALGYNLVLAPPGASTDAIARLHVDGVMVVDPTGRESGLAARTVPVVATGRPPGTGGPTSWVDNDHPAAARSALDHLRERGYARPALLTRSGRPSYVTDAVAAYRTWCAERRIEPVVTRLSGPLSEGAAAGAVEGLLARTPDVDAVYATLDRLAMGTLMGVENAGRTPGPDVGIVALSDSPLLLAARPQITAIDLRPEEIGRQAARLLVSRVTAAERPNSTGVAENGGDSGDGGAAAGGSEGAETHRLVGTELRPRASTRRSAG